MFLSRGENSRSRFRLLAFPLRCLEFLCAAIILAIFSYFLASLVDHTLHIDTWLRAVEGISGIAVAYTIIAGLLVCFLSGRFFSWIAIVLDVAFTGAFIYIAYKTRRQGDGGCNGNVITPVGSGNTEAELTVDDKNGGTTTLPDLHRACQLRTVCFAVAIAGIIFFILSSIVEGLLILRHKRGKKYGPGPSNNYTSGRVGRRGTGIFSRFRKRQTGPKNPDELTTIHPEPKMGYIAPTGTVVMDDETNKYGPGGMGQTHRVVQHGYESPAVGAPGKPGYTQANF